MAQVNAGQNRGLVMVTLIVQMSNSTVQTFAVTMVMAVIALNLHVQAVKMMD